MSKDLLVISDENLAIHSPEKYVLLEEIIGVSWDDAEVLAAVFKSVIRNEGISVIQGELTSGSVTLKFSCIMAREIIPDLGGKIGLAVEFRSPDNAISQLKGSDIVFFSHSTLAEIKDNLQINIRFLARPLVGNGDITFSNNFNFFAYQVV